MLHYSKSKIKLGLWNIKLIMQTRLLGVEVKKVKQVETMLLSLIPASKIKEQRERPWSTVKSLGLLHLLTKHFCLMSSMISLNSHKVHGISNVTMSLSLFRVLCTQRFLWVWTKRCLHSMWKKRLRVQQVRTWVTSRQRRELESSSEEKVLAT